MNNYVLFGLWFISLVVAFNVGLMVQRYLFNKTINEVMKKAKKEMNDNTLFIYIEEIGLGETDKEFFAYENGSNNFLASAPTMEDLAFKLQSSSTKKYIKCVNVDTGNAK